MVCPKMNGCLERCITVAPRQSGQKWVVSLERSEFTQEFQRQGEAEYFARQRAQAAAIAGEGLLAGRQY